MKWYHVYMRWEMIQFTMMSFILGVYEGLEGLSHGLCKLFSWWQLWCGQGVHDLPATCTHSSISVLIASSSRIVPPIVGSWNLIGTGIWARVGQNDWALKAFSENVDLRLNKIWERPNLNRDVFNHLIVDWPYPAGSALISNGSLAQHGHSMLSPLLWIQLFLDGFQLLLKLAGDRIASDRSAFIAFSSFSSWSSLAFVWESSASVGHTSAYPAQFMCIRFQLPVPRRFVWCGQM